MDHRMYRACLHVHCETKLLPRPYSQLGCLDNCFGNKEPSTRATSSRSTSAGCFGTRSGLPSRGIPANEVLCGPPRLVSSLRRRGGGAMWRIVDRVVLKRSANWHQVLARSPKRSPWWLAASQELLCCWGETNTARQCRTTGERDTSGELV